MPSLHVSISVDDCIFAFVLFTVAVSPVRPFSPLILYPLVVPGLY